MSLSSSDIARSNPSADAPLISNIDLNLTNTSTTESPLLVSADPDVFMGCLSFTQLILNAMNGRTIGLRAQPFYSNIDESIPSLALFQLPNEARDPVDQFFKIHHTVSPIFHEPTNRISFEDAISSPISERHHHHHSLALLNMIFAVCLSHRLMDQNTSPAISRRYYGIAIELLKPTLLRDWNISKVQALLLGAGHLQCSNSPDKCWNVLGLAIRIAHGLELHRASP
ncbi:hypothetical protein VE03_08235 [Pseudogymnoascus sp. 23342-1-I1]|nr:hypothetical protein VE03_08205 [Pseudogymnoascus sp. 23342-1-I1]OBT61946.1 hypothetical protein VE03_08235 [Pseudogymnoascus sp. 23342-1-I1]